MTEQFKRHIAYKLRIGDIFAGESEFDQERFMGIKINDKKIMRVNIIGNIVDKFENDGEKKYIFLTLDDGSGQIKLKTFGEDELKKYKSLSQGQTVTVIGLLRHWNNETYIAPEIIREQDPKYLVLRKHETEEERSKNSSKLEKEDLGEFKNKILEKIKSSEEEGGIELDKLIMDFRDISPENIKSTIEEFLKEGIIFEPRPDKLRYIG